MSEPITLCTRIRLAIGYLAFGIMLLAGGAFTVWMLIAAVEIVRAGEWWYVFGIAAMYPCGLSLVIMVPGAISTMLLEFDAEEADLGRWPRD